MTKQETQEVMQQTLRNIKLLFSAMCEDNAAELFETAVEESETLDLLIEVETQAEFLVKATRRFLEEQGVALSD